VDLNFEEIIKLVGFVVDTWNSKASNSEPIYFPTKITTLPERSEKRGTLAKAQVVKWQKRHCLFAEICALVPTQMYLDLPRVYETDPRHLKSPENHPKRLGRATASWVGISNDAGSEQNFPSQGFSKTIRQAATLNCGELAQLLSSSNFSPRRITLVDIAVMSIGSRMGRV
jgi:hypothetical protein